jgi:cobalt-zinc-cadmium efflux system outer membrane protein
LTLAHRSVFAAPSLQVGFDNNDPGGQPGLLPIVGLSLPLPLFNWNGGEVRQAAAARDRAQAGLDLARRTTGAELARARRGFTLARARLERDRGLLSSADRVAAMSLQAYAEGVVALPNVLEAQRNAREALARYVDDVAAANDAAAAVRLLTATDQP